MGTRRDNHPSRVLESRSGEAKLQPPGDAVGAGSTHMGAYDDNNLHRVALPLLKDGG